MNRSGRPVVAISFDFQNKVERRIDLAEIGDAWEQGHFVWIDVFVSDIVSGRRTLQSLQILNESIIDDVLVAAPSTRYARYENCLHLELTGCRLSDKQFQLERADVVVGKNYLLTVHHGPVYFLDETRREYASDFVQYAQSPSFLLYELWDHLIENYVDVQRRFEDQVEQVQQELLRHVDDDVFEHVASLGTDLLQFRKVVLPCRAVLKELSTRKSVFIGEATQSFLANMVGTVDCLLQDLLADREILSETLHLNMSMITHRTNEVVKRLTIVTVIFLPLTFLCGVYGMNFEYLPEKEWKWGYAAFWGLSALITIVLIAFLRRKKLL